MIVAEYYVLDYAEHAHTQKSAPPSCAHVHLVTERACARACARTKYDLVRDYYTCTYRAFYVERCAVGKTSLESNSAPTV